MIIEKIGEKLTDGSKVYSLEIVKTDDGQRLTLHCTSEKDADDLRFKLVTLFGKHTLESDFITC